MFRSVLALSPLLLILAGCAQTEVSITSGPIFLTNVTEEVLACEQAKRTGIHTKYEWQLVRLDGRENPIPPKIWGSGDVLIDEFAHLYLN